MSFKLVPGEAVGDGARRIAGEQIDSALREIQAGDPYDPETVHRFRKRCKKVRAVLRLVRGPLEKDGTYQTENAAFRDAARALSDLRDADVMLQSYDALMEHYNGGVHRPALAPVRRALSFERKRLHDEFDAGLPGRIEEARRFLERARQRVASWSIDGTGNGGDFEAVEYGLRLTYRRAYRARHAALQLPAAERLHEWRKRVKYHRNHIRLLRGVWKTMMEARAAEAETLGELLGDDHDLAVLRRRISVDHRLFGGIKARWPFVSLIDRRRADLQAEAFKLGARLFAAEPDALVQSTRRRWESWREETAPRRVNGAAAAE